MKLSLFINGNHLSSIFSLLNYDLTMALNLHLRSQVCNVIIALTQIPRKGFSLIIA